MRDNGIDVFIEGAVCFTNPDVELKINGTKRGVEFFVLPDGKDDMLEYITDRKKTVSDEDINQIKQLLGADM